MNNPPAGYVPAYAPFIHQSGLADQNMLYWRPTWDAPRVMKLPRDPAFNVADLWVRNCDALRDAPRSMWATAMSNSYAPLWRGETQDVAESLGFDQLFRS